MTVAEGLYCNNMGKQWRGMKGEQVKTPVPIELYHEKNLKLKADTTKFKKIWRKIHLFTQHSPITEE